MSDPVIEIGPWRGARVAISAISAVSPAEEIEDTWVLAFSLPPPLLLLLLLLR
jgi:hypothetical protein